MKRYLRLWLSFFKMSAMADTEYRINIVLRVITEIVWYAMQLSVFEVLYTHTSTISGWTVHDMRVFMGTLFLTDVTFMILFHENLEQVWSMVRKGDLDLYLVKPVNSQFMISCRKVSVAYLLNWLLVFGYLLWPCKTWIGPSVRGRCFRLRCSVYAESCSVMSCVLCSRSSPWFCKKPATFNSYGINAIVLPRDLIRSIRNSCAILFCRFFRWLSLLRCLRACWLKVFIGPS